MWDYWYDINLLLQTGLLKTELESTTEASDMR